MKMSMVKMTTIIGSGPSAQLSKILFSLIQMKLGDMSSEVIPSLSKKQWGSVSTTGKKVVETYHELCMCSRSRQVE